MDRIKKFGKNTFSSLSIRNYRLYFIGQAVSLSGTWMQSIAQGWLVLELTHSGVQLGIVVALQFVPLLLLGPWGGLFADRHNKRTILYYTNGVSALLSLGLGILVLSGNHELWHVYMFALCLGMVSIFDNPARQTLVPELVGDKNLKNAVSLNATVNNLARVIGPSISGLLIAGVGIAFCFLVNALSFVVGIGMLFVMNRKELHTVAPKLKQQNELRDGFRYVVQTPLIRNTLVMVALIGTFVFEFQVSLPILAQHTFGGDAASYALLMSALGLGSVVGGLFAAGRSKVVPRHLVIFAALCGVSLLVASCMPTLFLSAAALFVVGFFTINVTSLANTMIQLESKPSMRGRVMALWSMAMQGSTPIGGPIVGLAAEFGGGRWGVAVGGIAALLAAFFGLMTLRKKTKVHTSEHAK